MIHTQPMTAHTTAPPPPPTSAQPAPPATNVGRRGIDRVSRMPLDEFAGAGLVLRVNSQELGETVLFASDNARFENDEGLQVFRAAELVELLGRC